MIYKILKFLKSAFLFKFKRKSENVSAQSNFRQIKHDILLPSIENY